MKHEDTETEIQFDAELHAYVDGKLSPERMAAVEARLLSDERRRNVAEGWMADRALIREAAAAADTRPTDMRTELLGRELARRVKARRLRSTTMRPALRQLAASIAIFAAGWGGHALYMLDSSGAEVTRPSYVTQAVMLDSVIRGEREVSVSASEFQASLDWMSERMQRKIESPKLEALGLQIVSGRLVEGADGPMAHFTYANEAGEQITVMMSPHPVDEPAYPYALRPAGDQAVAYWTRGDVDVAIVGKNDRTDLETLARALQ